MLLGLLVVCSVATAAASSLSRYRQEQTQTKIKPVTYSCTFSIAGAPLYCPFHKVGTFDRGSLTATIVKTKGNGTDCLMVSPTDCVQIDKLKFKAHGDATLTNGHSATVRAKLALSNRFRVDTTAPPELDKDVFKFVAELDIYDKTANQDYDAALAFSCKFVPNEAPDCDVTELDFTGVCPF